MQVHVTQTGWLGSGMEGHLPLMVVEPHSQEQAYEGERHCMTVPLYTQVSSCTCKCTCLQWCLVAHGRAEGLAPQVPSPRESPDALFGQMFQRLCCPRPLPPRDPPGGGREEDGAPRWLLQRDHPQDQSWSLTVLVITLLLQQQAKEVQ